MIFEWDEEKNLLNKKKHGISFETAAYVFKDQNYIEMYDFEHRGRSIYSNRLRRRCTIRRIYREERKHQAYFCKISNRIGKEIIL